MFLPSIFLPIVGRIVPRHNDRRIRRLTSRRRGIQPGLPESNFCLPAFVNLVESRSFPGSRDR
jgi:hypothetical protein